MDHHHITGPITEALMAAPSLRALFLGGSFGNGLADAYSDFDFVLIADEGPTDAIAAHWRRAVEQTGEVVLWWDRNTRPHLINAVTADWTRTDTLILKPDQLTGLTQDCYIPLIDPDGLFNALPELSKRTALSPARLQYQIEEFIRILGLLHLAAGRQEYINGVLGIFHLRNLLVELMIEETAAPHRGGALHLNRLLNAGQRDLLTSLPAPVAAREAMIVGHLAYATAYLPRARIMAEARGVAWPERFEAVTWNKLGETLGIERPY